MNAFAVVAIVILAYGAFAVRLSRWSISMPMAMTAAGYLLGPGGFNIIHVGLATEDVKFFVEFTLGLLLFADASTLNLRALEGDAELPIRLLGIGLPLTVAAGALLGYGLYPGSGWAFAAMVAAILAPTDAALGLPVYTNTSLPVRIRRALNVESGLNDGIASPAVTFFVATAVVVGESGHHHWVRAAFSQIGWAILVGVLAGWAGSVVMREASGRGWTSGGPEKLAIMGIAMTAYFGSLALGGNGFIAAFVAGIVFGAVSRNRFAEPTDFTESLSTFLSLFVWLLFGAIVVHSALDYSSDWRPIVYAVLSLTVIRMIPVMISVTGLKFRPDTVFTMGWFGPRGLASIVFTLFAVIDFQTAGESPNLVVTVAGWTILMSVFAHGVTAGPFASWYSRRLAPAARNLPELRDMPEMTARRSHVWNGRDRQAR